MKTRILIASVAIAALGCGAASATTTHHARAKSSYAAPDQPVPYAQLDGYLKASPAQRSAMMSSTPATPMAAPADTSASATPATPSATAAPAMTQQPAPMAPTGAVNPPATSDSMAAPK